MPIRLSVLHTNDTHGRLALRGDPSPAAVRLRELRAELPGSLLLDAGDTVSAGNLGVRPGGEPALDVLSDLGCDAMCLGNRETHPRREIFPRKVDRARFPLLCANITPRDGALLPVVPNVTLHRGGLRIAVFGLTVPMFTRRQWSSALCDYFFHDPLAAAREQIRELRSESDVLIALTHLGFRQDCELAVRCPELDLLIGGHSHTDLQAPEWVGEVPVLQAWAFGYCAGVATLEAGSERARLVSWERRQLRDDVPIRRPGGRAESQQETRAGRQPATDGRPAASRGTRGGGAP